MSDTLPATDRTIKIGDRSFTLSGTFGPLRAIQQAFNDDILRVQLHTPHMRQDEIAKLIALGSGSDEEEIGALILDEIGAGGTDYGSLKLELFSWLGVAIAPKRDREKKALEMAKLVATFKTQLSPGPTTGDSASAFSTGAPTSSGEPPSST